METGRQADMENHSSPEWKPTSRDSEGTSMGGRIPELSLVNYWRLSVDKPQRSRLWGNQTWGNPPLWWVLSPGTLPGSHGEDKSPILLPRGEEKESFWNTTEHSVLANKAFPQKIVNQSLSYLGEGKYPTPAPSSYLVPQDRGRELGNT